MTRWLTRTRTAAAILDIKLSRIVGAVLITVTTAVYSQDGGVFDTSVITPDVHDGAGISAARIQSSDLPNETIDPYSGSLSLSFTDLVWPGDGGFDLGITRTYSSKIFKSKVNTAYVGPIPPGILDARTTGIGWSLHFGYVKKSILFTQDGTPLDQLQEPVSFDVCDLDDIGDSNAQVAGQDVHDNTLLVTPDGATMPLYVHKTNNVSYLPNYVDRMDFITDNMWIANCLNGGDGLVVIDPSGRKYTMDHKLVRVKAIDLQNGLWEAVWHTSMIEDANGNTMAVTYDGSYELEALLDEINTSDGRRVIFDYTSRTGPDIPLLNRISTPFFSGVGGLNDTAEQIWTYDYSLISGFPDSYYQLETVTRPDGLTWGFQYYSGSGLPIVNARDYGLQTVTHPYDGTVTYDYGFVHFYNSVTVPDRLYSKVVTSKATAGPNITAGNWTYQYSPQLPDSTFIPPGILVGGNALYPGKNVTTINSPRGREEYSHYGSYTNNTNAIIFFPLVGKVVQKDVFESGNSTPLRSEQFEWLNHTILSTEDNFNPVLVDPRHFQAPPPGDPPFDDGLLDEKISDTMMMRLSRKEIIQDGTSYISTIPNAYFWYNQPGSAIETGQEIRDFTYNYVPIDKDKNLYRTTAELLNYSDPSTGQYDIQRIYDPAGNLTNLWQYNVYEEYDVDAVGNRTQSSNALELDSVLLESLFSSHKLGLPQQEDHPEGVTISRLIGPLGTIAEETDGRGFDTRYQYDDLNRLTLVDYPFGADTAITYNSTGWEETRDRLTKRITVDGFGRPVCIWHDDTLSTEDIYFKREYDALGRVTFDSLPSSTACPTITEGTAFEYDALDRVTQITNPDGSTKTFQYLANNRVNITDERLNSTTYSYRSYGDPDEKTLVKIESPENIDTIIERDVLGNVLSVTQEESGGAGESITRTYEYNDSNFLIKEIHPETGETNYGRTPLGQMTSKTVGTSATTTYGYDGLFRNIWIDYPQAPDVIKEYDLNSNLKRIDNGIADITYDISVNNIIYRENHRIDLGNGQKFYSFTSDLNNLDQPYYLDYPLSQTIYLNPDAHGRPTTVTPYVTNATWHPNGATESITYANGVVTNLTLDDRQRVETIQSNNSIVDITYGYDPASNIASITDALVANNSYSFTYDNVNRLKTSQNGLDSGTFNYSVTGNIEEKYLGNKNLSYSYQDNKLLHVQEMGAGLLGTNQRVRFDYDVYGNVSARTSDPATGNPDPSSEFDLDQHDWEYDYNDAGQLTEIRRDGEVFRTYYYDGRNIRVGSKKNNDDSTVLHHIYNVNGKLLAEYDGTGSFRIKKEYYYLGDKLVAYQEPNLDAKLDIVVDTDKSSYLPGETILYTVTVANLGEVEATGVTIDDFLPAGVQYVSDSASAGSYDQVTDIWTINSIPINSEATLTIEAQLIE